MARNRIKFADPEILEMNCERGIRWRNHFPVKSSAESKEFPLAQARMVYRDYVFLEMELAATYSANNWYCYVIDAKADVN